MPRSAGRAPQRCAVRDSARRRRPRQRLRKEAAAKTIEARSADRRQRIGITLEYPAGVLGDCGEQPNPGPLAFEHLNGVQHTRSQAGITGG